MKTNLSRSLLAVLLFAGLGVASALAQIGISVTIDYGENSALALIRPDSNLTGAHTLTLSGTIDQDMASEAKSGAKGSTAVTPVVAIAVTNNTATAAFGGGTSPSSVTLTGDFSYETFKLMQDGKLGLAVVYSLGSVVAGLIGVWLALKLAGRPDG